MNHNHYKIAMNIFIIIALLEAILFGAAAIIQTNEIVKLNQKIKEYETINDEDFYIDGKIEFSDYNFYKNKKKYNGKTIYYDMNDRVIAIFLDSNNDIDITIE